MVKKLFLFDMDGTLTPARKSMDWEVLSMLTDLQRKEKYEIGIITGSDMDYIKQQCSLMFDMSPVSPHRIHFLPCNGTKYYYNNKCVYEQDMKAVMTEKKWNTLIGSLLVSQANMAQSHDIPLSSHFINFRGSMINWCPIGRTATHSQRETFIAYDKEHSLRKVYLEHLINNFICNDFDVTTKLGGDTSFDIYPTGWDKTYSLENTKHFDNYQIYFIGDRCGINGNDRELYMHPRTIARETSSPKQTIEIVNRFLNLTLMNNA